MKRRNFFLGLSLGTLGASMSRAQEPSVDCFDRDQIAPGVWVSSAMPIDPASHGSTTHKVGNGYGHLRLVLRYRAEERLDRLDVPERQFQFILVTKGGSNRPEIRLVASPVLCPTTTCQPDEDLQIRFKVDGQHLTRLRTRPGTQRSAEIADQGVGLTREQEAVLRNGRRLWFEVATRTGWERAELTIRDLDDWLKQAERFHRDRLRSAANVGRICNAPDVDTIPVCYMSTLIFHDLERPQTSFEVRNLYAMQEHFVQYQDQIRDYVRNAARIGRHKDEWDIKSAMAIFYYAFIWPSAILASTGLRWPPGLWFFTGFSLLKTYARVTGR